MSCDPESVSRTQMLWPFLAPPESSGELGRLGPYRVLKMLGQGGMGVVFKAEDVNLHRLVALKVMRPEISAQQRAKVAIPREAARDRRPQSRQRRYDLPGRRRSRRAVFGNGIPHRQIARRLAPPRSPRQRHGGHWHREANRPRAWSPPTPPGSFIAILSRRTFGSSCRKAGSKFSTSAWPGLVEGEFAALSINPALTMEGTAVGTPAFMAPEQARGEPGRSSQRFFSFGCVLYRMVTGRLPFQGNSICCRAHGDRFGNSSAGERA